MSILQFTNVEFRNNSICEFNFPYELVHFLKLKFAALFFIIIVSGMSACAIGDSSRWKEEVLLHDGNKIIVERVQSYGGHHEIGQKPPVKEQKLIFTLPSTNHTVTWKSEYSEDIGRANLNLLALHILNGTPYIVAEPNLCLAYNKWGRPNPPYVFFKYKNNQWIRIPLSKFPVEFNNINVVINTLEHANELSKNGIVSVSAINEFNSSLLNYPNNYEQYKTILRTPLKPRAVGVSCKELVYNNGSWRSTDGPRAPKK